MLNFFPIGAKTLTKRPTNNPKNVFVLIQIVLNASFHSFIRESRTIHAQELGLVPEIVVGVQQRLIATENTFQVHGEFAQINHALVCFQRPLFLSKTLWSFNF